MLRLVCVVPTNTPAQADVFHNRDDVQRNRADGRLTVTDCSLRASLVESPNSILHVHQLLCRHAAVAVEHEAVTLLDVFEKRGVQLLEQIVEELWRQQLPALEFVLRRPKT